MDRHVWQRLAIVVLAALVIFSINTFSPVSNGDGLSVITVQAKKKTHQLPNLLDQQITILAGLGINPDWVRGQNAVGSLIYGIVRPGDTVPAGTNEGYSYLATNSRDKEVSLFFKTSREKATIKYANRGEKLHTRTIPLSRLVEQSYRTKERRQQVSKYTSALRTEQLARYRKLGL